MGMLGNMLKNLIEVEVQAERELEYQVGSLLKEKELTIACAESCTGGLIASRLTDVNGSSAYFPGGIVSYSNEVKINQLGVSADTLARVGAVSKEVAEAMAEGVRTRLKADMGISTTGIAGPTGATDSKPVGLVYIAVSGPKGTVVSRNIFEGSRYQVRWQAAEKALEMTLEYLKGI